MKKGIFTALLLASGAALTVFLMNEEQNKSTYDNDDEKKMIKLRSEEESLELVRTIQEIESLPHQPIEENHVIEEVNFNHEVVAPLVQEQQVELQEISEDLDGIEEFTLPSFIEESPLDYAEAEEEILNQVSDKLPNDFDELNDEREEIDLAQFFKGIIDDEEILLSSDEPEVKHIESLELPKEEVLTIKEEIIDEPVQSVVELNDEEDFGKTAIFDLPKIFNTSDAAYEMENTMDIPSQAAQPVNPLLDFQNDDLDEIDLSELLSLANQTDEEVESPVSQLIDIEDEEIKRLFDTGLEEDKIEVAPQLMQELDDAAFEEFKNSLDLVDEDDLDVISFKTGIDESEIKLEDLVFEQAAQVKDVVLPQLEEIEVVPNVDVDHNDEVVITESVEESSTVEEVQDEALLEDLDIEALLEEDAVEVQEEEPVVEKAIPSQPQREYPDAIYQINELYPYLNLKFINIVFNNFEAFNEEFDMGSACRIKHKLQFPDSQNLIHFIEIIKGLGYEIVGTDENQNILIALDFINAESKILSEIYNISNQVNCLDGLYKGYELEHND